jgi:hypothetical protein
MMACSVEVLKRLKKKQPKLWASLRSAYTQAKALRRSVFKIWTWICYVPAPGAPTQVHLSWAQDPSTSFTVTWHTSSPKNPGLVEYRPARSGDWHRITGTTKPLRSIGSALHRASVAGLRPATGYEYRLSSDIGAAQAWSDTFITRTAPPPGPADFSFAFLCDTGVIGQRDGKCTGTKQIIDELLADRPHLVLGGGDYAYANRDRRYKTVAQAVDAWFVQMEPLLTQTPLMAQYGNHEIFLEERFEDWAFRFAHPDGFDNARDFSFDVGDVHFTALFVPGPPPSADRLDWLDADLADARQRGMRWLVVFQHEPIFAHGHSHPAKPRVREALGPLFEKHRVDLHLSGHDQNYERTYPLVGLPLRPMPASTSKTVYKAGCGVIYAKVSPGGKMSDVRHDFSRFTTDQQDLMAVRDDTAHHYCLVNVRASGELEVNTYSVAGNGSPKVLIDSCRIISPP